MGDLLILNFQKTRQYMAMTTVASYRPGNIPAEECVHFFVCFFFFLHQARASSFPRFLDHTQRLTTVSRTPLDE